MKRLIVILLLLLVAFQLYAQPFSDAWLPLSSKEKVVYLRGFLAGTGWAYAVVQATDNESASLFLFDNTIPRALSNPAGFIQALDRIASLHPAYDSTIALHEALASISTE